MAVKRMDQSLSNIFDFFKVYGIQIWTLLGLAFLIFTGIGAAVRLVECKLRLRSHWNIIEVLLSLIQLINVLI